MIEKKWQTICNKRDLVKNSGVCALLENSKQIAIFYTAENTARSISNWDPEGQANVLYRGIIGDEAGELYVASPLYKQRYLLTSGKCLDDDTLSVETIETRIIDEQVQVLA